MAAFTVADGTDWLQTLVFGGPNDRWRLDDYDITMHVKRSGQAEVLIDANLDNGKLVIANAAGRRLEINVGWSDIFAAGPGPFVFDVYFVDRATDIRSRSGPHTITITPAITLPEA
ncbi:hypothetical protein DYI37_03055 [Fulvimarina endophytica]|uniref:Uncharacterized protein n=1 Tax=Fulvimarina endophytica TaxID=2293836 RepID=A0A371XB19_9HYPH|nr:hypothetical protein [Fulvimarina endophytica]RFC66436.1 hypothetical protein DYI37_03055 [Fulvimarina endophytica]